MLTIHLWIFDKQIGGLQQKVDEMDITQRDLVAEYEEHVMHLKQEVGECQGHRSV